MFIDANRHRQCLSKMRYETKRQALVEIRRSRSRKFGQGVGLSQQHVAYHCPHCGFWHVGRDTPKHRRSRRRRGAEARGQRSEVSDQEERHEEHR